MNKSNAIGTVSPRFLDIRPDAGKRIMLHTEYFNAPCDAASGERTGSRVGVMAVCNYHTAGGHCVWCIVHRFRSNRRVLLGGQTGQGILITKM